MEIYFDNSATTKPLDEVIQYMTEIMNNYYGNPSALHKKGVEAERIIKLARENIADVLYAEPKEIIFTSGGTESNNTAIRVSSELMKKFGNKIITSEIEHPSVLNVFKELQKQGMNVVYLNVLQNGKIDLEQLEREVDSSTILVSIMHINNETGSINDLGTIGKIIKEKNLKTIFHVDMVQSFGKILLNPTKYNIDLISMSSHKINGPKGVGALYIRSGLNFYPFILGGGQENNMRSGTENVPGIGGFGLATKIREDSLVALNNDLTALKEHFSNRLKEIEDVFFNSPSDATPFILNVSFVGVRSEVLLHALEADGIYVSAGSACASRKIRYSPVLKAMGISNNRLESAIRFSFGVYNTIEEIDYCIDSLKKNLLILKKFKRR